MSHLCGGLNYLNARRLEVVYRAVKVLFKVVALCLALLWVPMVSHCDIEHLPGMAFIACCDVAQPEPHPDKDCETDVCATVESGHYKTEDQAVTAPTPCLVTVLILPALDVQPLDLAPASPSFGASREEPPPNWVFTLRQASSPRAPSNVA